MAIVYLDKYITSVKQEPTLANMSLGNNGHNVMLLTDKAVLESAVIPAFESAKSKQHRLELQIPYKGTKYYLTVTMYEILTMNPAVRNETCEDGLPVYVTFTQVVEGRQSKSKGHNRKLPDLIAPCNSLPIVRTSFNDSLKLRFVKDSDEFMDHILAQQ